MAVEIPLTRGYVAVVDDEDVAIIGRYAWSVAIASPTLCYAASAVGTRKTIRRLSMHRLIMGAGVGDLVDHVDGDGLNNRRSNLRLVTRRQHASNSRKCEGTTSKYKGVSWNINKWRARVSGRVPPCVGRYKTEIAAAYAYDQAAREIHGEFGTYNFPLPGERSALTGLIEPWPAKAEAA